MSRKENKSLDWYVGERDIQLLTFKRKRDEQFEHTKDLKTNYITLNITALIIGPSSEVTENRLKSLLDSK